MDGCLGDRHAGFRLVILLEATLSFLGFGLTRQHRRGARFCGRQTKYDHRTMACDPSGLAIMVTVLAINLTADGASDIMDPKLKMSIFRRIAQKEPASDLSTDQEIEEAADTRSEPTTTNDEVEPPLLLKVRDLSVEFPLENKVVKAVRHASFEVHRGQTLGIVGESGSGKSVTASSIIQLIDSPGRVTNGEFSSKATSPASITTRWPSCAVQRSV
jgi:ABC-type transport system involved in cytochrome bd biosynthesis fused ATPase/permease subunit